MTWPSYSTKTGSCQMLNQSGFLDRNWPGNALDPMVMGNTLSQVQWVQIRWCGRFRLASGHHRRFRPMSIFRFWAWNGHAGLFWKVREGHRLQPSTPESEDPACLDCECQRNGTANLFMPHAPLEGWRHVKVTDRRTRRDFAGVLQDLADIHFPGRRIVLVMDSLNTHRLSTLYETCEPGEASRLFQGFEVHHAPKHGSWPDMAEMEMNVLSPRCLRQRMPDRETMIAEVGAWEDGRNEEAATTGWRFRAEDARMKLKSPYPSNL